MGPVYFQKTVFNLFDMRLIFDLNAFCIIPYTTTYILNTVLTCAYSLQIFIEASNQVLC